MPVDPRDSGRAHLDAPAPERAHRPDRLSGVSDHRTTAVANRPHGSPTNLSNQREAGSPSSVRAQTGSVEMAPAASIQYPGRAGHGMGG